MPTQHGRAVLVSLKELSGRQLHGVSAIQRPTPAIRDEFKQEQAPLTPHITPSLAPGVTPDF